jgi:hypothetical protein
MDVIYNMYPNDVVYGDAWGIMVYILEYHPSFSYETRLRITKGDEYKKAKYDIYRKPYKEKVDYWRKFTNWLKLKPSMIPFFWMLNVIYSLPKKIENWLPIKIEKWIRY